MKKTFKFSLILVIICFVTINFIACSDDDDSSSSSESKKNQSGIKVVKKNLADVTSMELENYSYKIIFSVPAAKAENWTAL